MVVYVLCCFWRKAVKSSLSAHFEQDQFHCAFWNSLNMTPSGMDLVFNDETENCALFLISWLTSSKRTVLFLFVLSFKNIDIFDHPNRPQNRKGLVKGSIRQWEKVINLFYTACVNIATCFVPSSFSNNAGLLTCQLSFTITYFSELCTYWYASLAVMCKVTMPYGLIMESPARPSTKLGRSFYHLVSCPGTSRDIHRGPA